MSGGNHQSRRRHGRALGIGALLAVLLVLSLGVLTFFKTGQSDFAGYLALLGAVITAALSLLARKGFCRYGQAVEVSPRTAQFRAALWQS